MGEGEGAALGFTGGCWGDVPYKCLKTGKTLVTYYNIVIMYQFVFYKEYDLCLREKQKPFIL